MKETEFIDELLLFLPYWHYKVERPLKQLQKNTKISFETYYCLKMLSHQDSMSMKELSSYLHMPKQQVTQLVKTLCTYDFIEKSSSDSDLRINTVKITERGFNYLTNEVNLNEKFLDILKEEFTKEEIKVLKSNVENMIKIMIGKGSTK